MFNVDMIGDRDLNIHRESRSDSGLTDLIFRDARTSGYGRYFLERSLSVEDDHMAFVRAGIPAVELISLDYGPFNIFWHTPFDTVGKCSTANLGIVGRVLLDALDDLESGRTPKPHRQILLSLAPDHPFKHRWRFAVPCCHNRHHAIRTIGRGKSARRTRYEVPRSAHLLAEGKLSCWLACLF